MISVRAQVRGVNETLQVLAQTPSLIRQAGMAGVREGGEHLLGVIRDDFLQGPYPQFIERRSGSFRATFRRGHAQNIFTMVATGPHIVGTFGSKDRRARLLNDGGTVTSNRPGGWLAVRTEFTKTGRGVVREKYRQPLRTLPNTFVARGTVFERIGRRIVPIAWLRRSVFIEGRRYMEQGERKATPGVLGLIQQGIDTLATRLTDGLARIR